MTDTGTGPDFSYQSTKISEEATPNLTNAFKLPLDFTKRSGTTDLGKNYEHLYIANLILKLLTDDSVEDFRLSSNNEIFGSFDDIVVEIKYYDNKKESDIFAIQSKHGTSSKTLTIASLEAASGNFSIKKYLEDCDESLLDGTVKFVLFTNYKTNFEEIAIQIESKTGKIKSDVFKTAPNDLIATSKQGYCYAFESNDCKPFFQNFFLYTNQENVIHLEANMSKLFQDIFNCEKNIVTEYVNFITKWSLKQGRKEALDKAFMMRSIFLQVTTCFIKKLSFSHGMEIHEKGNIFKEAVSKFDVVPINKCKYKYVKQLFVGSTEEVSDLRKVNKIRSKYQLPIDKINKVADLNNEDEEISKLMWLLGKCPLMLEGCPQVYKAAEICKQTQLILLVYPEGFEPRMINNSKFQPTVFETLSDLQNYSPVFEAVLNTFTYSLEGQQEVILKHLIDLDKEFAKKITTHHLVQMFQGPLLIGQNEVILPSCHIDRKVSKILIDFNFLKNMPSDTIVTISGVKYPDNFGKSLPKDTTIIRFNNKSHVDFDHWKKGCKFIYLCENDLVKKLFEDLYLKGLATVHHFRHSDERCLEWITSRNCTKDCKNKRKCIDELQKFLIDNDKNDTILESQLLNEAENNVNILCANPGMGKTTLMRSLKRKTPSSIWFIVIIARNDAMHFKKYKKDFEKFLEFFFIEKFKEHDKQSLEYKLFRTLMNKRQIRITWDGLDEITENSLNFILTVVEDLSESGVIQWLSSRRHLRSMLEIRFGVFARNIKEFDESEQQVYVKRRLDITSSSEELPKVFGKIITNIMSFSNTNILGIPLQIYMLTELLFQKRDKYLNQIGGVFTIVDLYEHFVDEKFNILYIQKYRQDINIEMIGEKCQNKKKKQLNYYKEIASAKYLHNVVKIILHKTFGYSTECKHFLKKIHQKGDKFGLLNVIDKNNLEFSHNSYGEYFTALFLFENNPKQVRDSSFLSDSKYQNIRFFLDLMLSQQFKIFVAVLYKNMTLLNQCTEEDFNQKDDLGRKVTTVAFSWVEKDENPSFLTLSCEKIAKNVTSKDISKRFKRVKQSLSFPIKKLIHLVPFLVLLIDENNGDINEATSNCILYYAIKFDYPDIFDDTKFIFSETLLVLEEVIYTSLFFNSRNILEKLIYLGKIPHDELLTMLPKVLQKLNGRNDELLIWMLKRLNIDLLNLASIHFACESYNAAVVQLMIDQGAQLDTPDKIGRIPLHLAIVNPYFSCEIITLLLDKGATINIPDVKGDLPVHVACCYGESNTVQLLLDKDRTTIDVPNANGELPIHKACDNYGNTEVVQLLLDKCTRLDVPDANGELPIHKACYGYVKSDIVKLLLDKGAEIDVPNANGELPIHIASYNEKVDVVHLLLNEGAKVDIPDRSGKLPIDRTSNSEIKELLGNWVKFNNKMKKN